MNSFVFAFLSDREIHRIVATATFHLHKVRHETSKSTVVRGVNSDRQTHIKTHRINPSMAGKHLVVYLTNLKKDIFVQSDFLCCKA